MKSIHAGPVEISHALTSKDEATIAALRAQLAPSKGKMDGPQARGMFDEVMEQTPDAPGVSYEEGTVGGVRGVWCHPSDPRPGVALLHLHGGAYVLGSAHAHRHLAGQIAARTRAAAFVAEYRLAPEHAFPAALDDARAAYRGLVEQGTQRIAIVGDSAGGGLALALLSVAHAEAVAGRGLALDPSGAVVMSPWTDLALTGPSLQSRADDDPLVTREMLALAGASYLRMHDPLDPLASPLYGELAGLPPIQLHVGTREVLLDDALRYAERARAAGVDATAHAWEGMTHVFPSSVGSLDAADQALDIMAAFLVDELGVPLRALERPHEPRGPKADGRRNEMTKENAATVAPTRPRLPPDDPTRELAMVDPEDPSPALRHVALVGDVYTILLSGAQTAGRYCLIDMSVPHCGGPGPHRHDFEEMFTLLEGEIQLTFRGQERLIKAGMTVNVPANAPHFFTNVSGKPSRMLCMCTPAGQEEFFLAIGTPLAARTAPAPKLSAEEQQVFIKKAAELAPSYRTELLGP
jgi:monoterpene epsilon-lactone hydrolase